MTAAVHSASVPVLAMDGVLFPQLLSESQLREKIKSVSRHITYL